MNKELEEMYDALKQKGRDLITSIFLEFFRENHKVVDELSWTQYTSYFNDGDACYFYPHIDDIFDEYEDDVSMENLSELTEIPDEFYLWCFGDHVEVTVGYDIFTDSVVFSVSEYTDHD